MTKFIFDFTLNVVEHYYKDDIKFSGDYVVDFIVNEVVVYKEQDYYHNRVNQKIEGYIDCLNSLGITYTLTRTKIADYEYEL